MHRGSRKIAGNPLDSAVRRQMHLPAARDQFMRERFGREEVTTRTSSRKQDSAFSH